MYPYDGTAIYDSQSASARAIAHMRAADRSESVKAQGKPGAHGHRDGAECLQPRTWLEVRRAFLRLDGLEVGKRVPVGSYLLSKEW